MYYLNHFYLIVYSIIVNLYIIPKYIYNYETHVYLYVIAFQKIVSLNKGFFNIFQINIYLDEVYLVTALVPSETACFASSPGRSSLTAVWISRDVMVDLLL